MLTWFKTHCGCSRCRALLCLSLPRNPSAELLCNTPATCPLLEREAPAPGLHIAGQECASSTEPVLCPWETPPEVTLRV